VSYDELVNSPSRDTLERIKECGTVVVRGVVEENKVSIFSFTAIRLG
jgi:hypothetical protein